MSLTKLKNINHKLSQSFRISLNFSNDILTMNQMKKKKSFTVISFRGRDFRGCIENTEQKKLVYWNENIWISILIFEHYQAIIYEISSHSLKWLIIFVLLLGILLSNCIFNLMIGLLRKWLLFLQINLILNILLCLWVCWCKRIEININFRMICLLNIDIFT